MTLLAPVWLLGLLPLAGLVIWLLTSRRERQTVPFLDLWKGPVKSTTAQRTMRPPPVAVLCALSAILIAILGASRPLVSSSLIHAPERVTIVLDRGITMSARLRNDSRWQHLVTGVYSYIQPAVGTSGVDVVCVPSGLEQTPPEWRPVLTDVQSSAFDSHDELVTTVARCLAASNRPVIVLSDQHLPMASPRLIQIAPSEPVRNVGIVRIGAVERPRAQVMVRVRNQSELSRATLSVGKVSQTVELPARDQERDYFLDVPTLDRVVEAGLDIRDDLEADNAAWLVRTRSYPVIETRAGVSDALARMIEVYRRNRPSDEQSPKVVVAGTIFQLSLEQPGVAVCDPGAARESLNGRIAVSLDHPIVKSIDWNAISKDATAMSSPGEGWTPVVTSGKWVLVAIRQLPARQVWVGFDSPTFSSSKDFVIFWSNVLDWIGQSGATISGGSMRQLSAEWSPLDERAGAFNPRNPNPGVYVRKDGTVQALNALEVRFDAPIQTDWRERLAALHGDASKLDLTPLLLLCAMALLIAASLKWNR